MMCEFYASLLLFRDTTAIKLHFKLLFPLFATLVLLVVMVLDISFLVV